MKDFLKYMLAAMVGFILTLGIIFIVLLIVIASLVSFADEQVVEVSPNSILHMTLDKPIYDRAPKNPLNLMDLRGMELSPSPGLDVILETIRKAAEDPAISGIYLELGTIQAGMGTTEEIRNALAGFKRSGKFIVAYSEAFSQKAYYLASVADKVYLNPKGLIEFKGLAAGTPFFKGTLEKLDVDISVIRHGKFKSAAEPFIYDQMSPENEQQLQEFIDDVWENMLERISRSRDIPLIELDAIADRLDALYPEKALELKLVDALYYYDEVKAELKGRLGLSDDKTPNTVALAKYVYAPEPVKKKFVREKIAVVYAIGGIIDGKGDDLTVGSKDISEAIRKARKNDKVKAIVMRVNSPGGSALASEVIRREAQLAAAEKPFIISMGDMAASGGYWISCTANKIYADSTTLTGSIGVFGMIPDLGNFFRNKLGITFDYAYTNLNAGFLDINRPMTDYEKVVMERQIDKIYYDFLHLVSEGRNMPVEKVDSIAQGRIWSATDALTIGLIDQIGGLEEAIAGAAEAAGLSEYSIYSLPAQKEPLQQIIDQLTGQAGSGMLRNELGEYYAYYEFLKNVSMQKGIHARMPYMVIIE
jgi:protease-4